MQSFRGLKNVQGNFKFLWVTKHHSIKIFIGTTDRFLPFFRLIQNATTVEWFRARRQRNSPATGSLHILWKWCCISGFQSRTGTGDSRREQALGWRLCWWALPIPAEVASGRWCLGHGMWHCGGKGGCGRGSCSLNNNAPSPSHQIDRTTFFDWSPGLDVPFPCSPVGTLPVCAEYRWTGTLSQLQWQCSWASW